MVGQKASQKSRLRFEFGWSIGPKCRLMEKTKENGTAQLLFNLEPQCYDYISCKTKLIFQKPL